MLEFSQQLPHNYGLLGKILNKITTTKYSYKSGVQHFSVKSKTQLYIFISCIFSLDQNISTSNSVKTSVNASSIVNNTS